MPKPPAAPPFDRGNTHLVQRRAEALDALRLRLPFDRREVLAELLTDEDVETLRHLAKQGIGENSLRARFRPRLSRSPAGCRHRKTATLLGAGGTADQVRGASSVGPSHAQTDLAHGMPQEVTVTLQAQGLLRVDGPHAPSTSRRLSSWSTLTGWRGLVGPFNAPGLRSAVKLAVRASARPRARKSNKAVTADILAAVLKACGGDRLVDVRDRALLLVAFASGGRRRSEMSSLRLEQLIDADPVAADPKDPDGSKLPCTKIQLGRTKTTEADQDAVVLLVGRPVVALRDWLHQVAIAEGAIFRGIDRWGQLDRKALTPQAVN